MRDLVEVSDEDCKNKLRMDRSSFHRLCYLLQTIGWLNRSKYITVPEKVAIFLSIIAHHTKNRCVKFQFKRSGQTVSKYFHVVLQSILKLHNILLVKPQPVPDDSTAAENLRVVWVHWMRHTLMFMFLHPIREDIGIERERCQ